MRNEQIARWFRLLEQLDQVAFWFCLIVATLVVLLMLGKYRRTAKVVSAVSTVVIYVYFFWRLFFSWRGYYA